MADIVPRRQPAASGRSSTRGSWRTASARSSRTTSTDNDRAFIERLDMFFLATVDEQGHANCSYKGGEPGFVRVVDERTIAFPNYDGNGMYLSMGNVLQTKPGRAAVHRLREPAPDAAQRRGDDRPRRPADGGVPGGAVHRAGAGAGGLPELPALHPQDEAGAALALRAEGASARRRCRAWKKGGWVDDVLPERDIAREAEREVLDR